MRSRAAVAVNAYFQFWLRDKRCCKRPHSSTAAQQHGRTAGRTAARPHRTSAWRHGGTAAQHGARRHGDTALLHQTARLYVCMAARPCGRTAAPHSGTATQHGARPHSGSARLYVCTAERPCGHTARTAGARARPTRRSPLESSPRTHASASSRPLSRPCAQRPPVRAPQSAVDGGSPYTRLRFHPPTQLGQSARSARREACVHQLLDRIGDHCFGGPSFGGPCAERRGEGADGAASTVRADGGATGARCSDCSGLGGTAAERIARPMCARAVAER